ncbi:hypothetical protein FOA52_000096 [Chlamydomonas sp. UWO 241]|nr:hypothetical protein FOA52_000096 [Chlamydomonas sp. UWO 241]
MGPDTGHEASSARPNDEAILSQQNTIRAEAASVPYVGDVEELASLKSEYKDGNQIFCLKIDKLGDNYSHLRRTRGDGNCYFRAFFFGYLEALVNNNDVAEATRFAGVLRGWRQKLIDSHFQELVFEDAMELLMDQVTAIGRDRDPMSADLLLTNARDDMVSNMIVMFLRLVTSAAIQQRADHFAPFIMGMYDEAPAVDHFCQKYVEPMGEESDHVHIVALTDALQVAINVVYLDRSGTADFGGDSQHSVDVNTHSFIPEGSLPDTKPAVSLLYRPGHYDILYAHPRAN